MYEAVDLLVVQAKFKVKNLRSVIVSVLPHTKCQKMRLDSRIQLQNYEKCKLV